jgi:hypothetical protein
MEQNNVIGQEVRGVVGKGGRREREIEGMGWHPTVLSRITPVT